MSAQAAPRIDRYSFIIQVDGIEPRTDRYEALLYDAGCDDALVAVIENTLFVDFDREAPSYEEAVSGATRNVEMAGGKVARILPLDAP